MQFFKWFYIAFVRAFLASYWPNYNIAVIRCHLIIAWLLWAWNNNNSKVLAFDFSLSTEIKRSRISSRTKEALARMKSEGLKLGRTNEGLTAIRFVKSWRLTNGTWWQLCCNWAQFLTDKFRKQRMKRFITVIFSSQIQDYIFKNILFSKDRWNFWFINICDGIQFINIKGITSISTYTHAKELGIVVCQNFHHQVFIALGSRGGEYLCLRGRGWIDPLHWLIGKRNKNFIKTFQWQFII